MGWTKTTARRDLNHLSSEIWCMLYHRFYGSLWKKTYPAKFSFQVEGLGLDNSVPDAADVDGGVVRIPTGICWANRPWLVHLRESWPWQPLWIPVVAYRSQISSSLAKANVLSLGRSKKWTSTDPPVMIASSLALPISDFFRSFLLLRRSCGSLANSMTCGPVLWGGPFGLAKVLEKK